MDGDGPDESTPSSTNSQRTPSDVLGHRDTLHDEGPEPGTPPEQDIHSEPDTQSQQRAPKMRQA